MKYLKLFESFDNEQTLTLIEKYWDVDVDKLFNVLDWALEDYLDSSRSIVKSLDFLMISNLEEQSAYNFNITRNDDLLSVEKDEYELDNNWFRFDKDTPHAIEESEDVIIVKPDVRRFRVIRERGEDFKDGVDLFWGKRDVDGRIFDHLFPEIDVGIDRVDWVANLDRNELNKTLQKCGIPYLADKFKSYTRINYRTFPLYHI